MNRFSEPASIDIVFEDGTGLVISGEGNGHLTLYPPGATRTSPWDDSASIETTVQKLLALLGD